MLKDNGMTCLISCRKKKKKKGDFQHRNAFPINVRVKYSCFQPWKYSEIFTYYASILIQLFKDMLQKQGN